MRTGVVSDLFISCLTCFNEWRHSPCPPGVYKQALSKTEYYLLPCFPVFNIIGAYALQMAGPSKRKDRIKGWISLASVPFPFSIPPFHIPHPPTHPSDLSNSAREARAQRWRSDICQIKLGCFKVLQNYLHSIPRNCTWLLTEAVCCAQDHRTFSSFSLLTSGCQSVVKNKIITNPPCCKWFHNYAGSFQGSVLVIFPQDWFSQINEWD